MFNEIVYDVRKSEELKRIKYEYKKWRDIQGHNIEY